MRDHGGSSRTCRATLISVNGGFSDQSLKTASGVIALQFKRFVEAFGAQQILGGEAGLDHAIKCRPGRAHFFGPLSKQRYRRQPCVMVAWPSRSNASKPPGAAIVG